MVQSRFNSCEQYMMYYKALLFKDNRIAEKILIEKDVALQKAYGREVKGFNQEIWDKNKLEIVKRGNYLKFSQNDQLKKELLNTKDKILVEGSPRDVIWGVGLHYNNDDILDEAKWNGQNLLGKALMEVRDILSFKDESLEFDKLSNDDKIELDSLIIKYHNELKKRTTYFLEKYIEKKNFPEINILDSSDLWFKGLKKWGKAWSLREYEIRKIKEENNEKRFLKEIQSSIVEAKEDIIAHGCNCVGGYGAGIAKYIAEKYPESKNEYLKICRSKKFNLGDVQFVKSKNKLIANCATQYNYGRYLKMDKESVEKRYLAIEQCLKKLYKRAKKENLTVALPRIGCGRARSDWNRVKNIIKKVFHDYPVTIYFLPDKYSK